MPTVRADDISWRLEGMSQASKRIASDPRVGSLVGEYRIDSLIAVGAMGKVYKATAGDGTPVALKLVKEDLAKDETFRRRFRREARIAQTVRHPHVVSLRDTGEHDGIPYLAAQFIEGPALDQKLQAEGRLDVATTVRMCAHVADGLQALWEAGMVHRDIKPGNILLDRAGNAYITDFGLAKDSQGSVLTRPGQALGSMHYMAPEQIRGEPVTGATDIYALGCVMFECVYGQPPFGDREGMNVLWAHLQDEPPDPPAPPAEFSPGAPAELSPAFHQALRAALAKEPAQRPGTSVEYARSLARAAGIPVVDPTS